MEMSFTLVAIVKVTIVPAAISVLDADRDMEVKVVGPTVTSTVFVVKVVLKV